MTATRPLEGVRVVELGHIFNGPYAGMLLAHAGAEVIKVEPRHGEHLRRRPDSPGAHLPFVMVNSGKLGATLDLKHPRGKELLERLIEVSDVVIENFSPGVMERLGLGEGHVRSLNPRLVYASGSGYGKTGPGADLPAMDVTVQAMAGVVSTTGFPDQEPVKAGPAFADFLGGAHLFGGIVAALYGRARQGAAGEPTEVTTVEVAMQDAIYPTLASNVALHLAVGESAPPRTGNRHGALANSPYNIYRANDGHVAVICISESQWSALAGLMDPPGLDRDERFVDKTHRVRNMDALDGLIGTWIGGMERDQAVALLRAAGVPTAPVRSIDEVVGDEIMRSRGMVSEVDFPGLGTVTVPGSPIRYGVASQRPRSRAPLLGEHNEYVYRTLLGLPADEYDRLTTEGVV